MHKMIPLRSPNYALPYRRLSTLHRRLCSTTQTDIGSDTPRFPPVPSVFVSQSYRRVRNSPTLPLEAVAIPHTVQAEVHALIKEHSLSAKNIRKHVKALDLLRAQDFERRKIVSRKGQPIVRRPLKYDEEEAVSYAALRMPATLAANVFVMAEIRRLLPDFAPIKLLDFGTGVGVSVMAAARAFPNPTPDQGSSSIRMAALVDQSEPMLRVGSKILKSDPAASSTSVSSALSLHDKVLRQAEFDIVCASYSLNEIVRKAMANPLDCEDSDRDGGSVSREKRVKLAENNLRRTVKSLWSRTAPGGLLIVVEDGTAAGFEIVSFARDLLLRYNDAETVKAEHLDSNSSGHKDRATQARVVAPCLHSRTCPLRGSITRRRICRFQQRLNRPLFSRNARPLPTGYEDEYFSFIAIQKILLEEKSPNDTEAKGWGRLIRPPLMKGKHIALDACTKDGNLERRVVSKKNAPLGSSLEPVGPNGVMYGQKNPVLVYKY
ncbi:Methyltransferase-like protein 17, mitochondrial [Gracilariopsis chorda]|uniref:Methyltransferase-like protein 17, mitochondrial n=1 Tax=Gracilariopsis chorda TaxID=448386 RepID=A0A2V3J0H7_9FLOR|nr:Methyltransferase-like protein 17, mitochondrial [Gracilariopsis chorda]|eukprot:PXF47916.1 Methyltransferase-like protein 17, mitochondrial [Gracilariopsis chorda]